MPSARRAPAAPGAPATRADAVARPSVEQVLEYRLRRQFLLEPADGSLEVVRVLAGIQVQVPSATEASAASRRLRAMTTPVRAIWAG